MQTTANTSVESPDVESWGAWVSRANNAYIGFLTLTLVATVLIIVFNNQLNKAKDLAYRSEKAASDKQISDANKAAADADERAGIANKAAGTANERAEGLEGANLTLRGQIATLESDAADAKRALAEQQGRTASLEKAAADAKAAQQRVEKDLAIQQQRAAKAETELAVVKKRQESRHLPKEQFLKALRESLQAQVQPRTEVLQQRITVLYPSEDVEAHDFAAEIAGALRDADWKDVWPAQPILPSLGMPLPGVMKLGGGAGLTIIPLGTGYGRPEEDGNSLMFALSNAFGACGFPVNVVSAPFLISRSLKIIVGPRP